MALTHSTPSLPPQRDALSGQSQVHFDTSELEPSEAGRAPATSLPATALGDITVHVAASDAVSSAPVPPEQMKPVVTASTAPEQVKYVVLERGLHFLERHVDMAETLDTTPSETLDTTPSTFSANAGAYAQRRGAGGSEGKAAPAANIDRGAGGASRQMRALSWALTPSSSASAPALATASAAVVDVHTSPCMQSSVVPKESMEEGVRDTCASTSWVTESEDSSRLSKQSFAFKTYSPRQHVHHTSNDSDIALSAYTPYLQSHMHTHTRRHAGEGGGGGGKSGGRGVGERSQAPPDAIIANLSPCTTSSPRMAERVGTYINTEEERQKV